MKTAQFTNWTNEEFVGWWDGKSKKFPPGKSVYMPEYLAIHFAKHLTNRELLRTDRNGNFIYKDGDKMTSPKHLGTDNDRVPKQFMDLFYKAFKEDDDVEEQENDLHHLINSVDKNKRAKEEEKKEEEKQEEDPKKEEGVQVAEFPEDDEEEEEFGEEPKED